MHLFHLITEEAIKNTKLNFEYKDSLRKKAEKVFDQSGSSPLEILGGIDG